MKRQLRIDRRCDRQLAGRTYNQGVAIGRLPLRIFHRQPPAGAGLVLDHHRLADILRELLPDDARQQVVAAAGGKADDHTDRPCRIVRLALCPSNLSRGGVMAATCAAMTSDTLRNLGPNPDSRMAIPPVSGAHYLPASQPS